MVILVHVVNKVYREKLEAQDNGVLAANKVYKAQLGPEV
jgi:hypothetical protein